MNLPWVYMREAFRRSLYTITGFCLRHVSGKNMALKDITVLGDGGGGDRGWKWAMGKKKKLKPGDLLYDSGVDLKILSFSIAKVMDTHNILIFRSQ